MVEFFDIKDASDEEILNIARKLRVAYGLKKTLRYSTERNHEEHSESVAEHVFALFFLAHFFLPLENPEGTWNKENIFAMLLFHDFGEIINGDIPYHIKTEEDEAREQDDAKKVFGMLPLHLQDLSLKSWSEYESKYSPEAKFAQAIDKIEPLFELADEVNERSMKRLKFTYELNIEHKRKAIEKDFPIMWRFVEVMSNDMRRRGVFWES